MGSGCYSAEGRRQRRKTDEENESSVCFIGFLWPIQPNKLVVLPVE